jgi:regulator of sigma E protease
MSIAGTFLLYTLPFLALIFVVIVVHEWGHFWVARRLGIKVEAFSMGFGPELFGWVDRYGTRFKLCLLPLGGYVKMFGEGDATRDSSGQMRPLTSMERTWSYGYRPVSHRAAVVAAGPLVNILFGTLLLVLFFYGSEVMPPASNVAQVAPGSSAAAAGLMAEDKIVTVNGVEAEDQRVLVRLLLEDAGKSLEIVVQRGDRLMTLTAQGIGATSAEKPLASFGITTEGRLLRWANPIPAVKTGLIQAAGFAQKHFTALGEIATGARPMAELAGPVGIASVTGDTFASYGLLGLTILTALLSINVGLVNLLPIPVLDGGHLVFMGFEVLLGKPLSPRIIKVCSWGGLCVIAVLVLLVTGHDLFRLAV